MSPPRSRRQGLAAPLDLSRFPAYSQLSPQLTSLPLVRANGQVYGVPFMWGPNPMLYDTTFSRSRPIAGILWDPKYQGKVSVWDDLSTVYMAAQVLGYDKPDPSHLYNLNDEQLEAVKKKLLELKPNIRKMWSTGGELTNLFQNHEIVAAMGWPLIPTQLRKMQLSRGRDHSQRKHHGLDRSPDDHRGQREQRSGVPISGIYDRSQDAEDGDGRDRLPPANPQAAQFMTPDEVKNLHLDDVDNYQKRIYFWQNVPRRAKYNEIWNEVKAAQ